MSVPVVPRHMNVREATTDDGDAIREVARRSLEASYSLSPQAIEGAIEKWYTEDALAEMLADEAYLVLVAEEDSEVIGFAESLGATTEPEADLLWLHVAPEHRGKGAGEALFEATRERLSERGVEHLRGRVLADNAEGNDFYERHGFEKVGEGEVEIDGSPYVENVYVEEVPDLEPIAGPDGEELFVDRADADRGSKAEFATVYTDPNRETKYSYFCTNCDSLVTSMDAMGRLECESCGNHRKPTRWDAAYM